MNCFIASAFNYKDVDAVYDQAIRPVLREFKISPVRVDRDEHNDDIDDRIFHLIDKSDLCIADITYARPSVYYEAGYAFGSGKPVIYMVRRDHFRPREDDPSGNLRVHFDLQMKNIVPWAAPDNALKNRLRRRLRHVTRPMFRRQKKDEAEKAHVKAFAALSVAQQRATLRSKALNLLQARGYSSCSTNHHDFSLSFSDLYLAKTCGRAHRQVYLRVLPAFNISELRSLPHVIPSITRKKSESIERLESVCFLVSLRPVRPSTLRSLFPNSIPLGERVFLDQRIAGVRDVPQTTHIIAVDGVRSVESFVIAFKARLGEWEQYLQGMSSPVIS